MSGPVSGEHPAALLRRLERRARRSLGQNFLAAPSAVRRIVELAEVGPGDRVLEIGPGLGVLTGALLAAGASVTAVELDEDLAGFLDERFAEARAAGRFSLHRGDAAGLDWGRLLEGEGWAAVANLPYNVGTRILVELLARPDRFSRLALMLQEEVARRVVAPPGDRRRGSLSVYVEARAEARIGLRLGPGAFHPPPKVRSAVVRLELRPHPALDGAEGPPPATFDAVVRAAFAQPRKTIRNNLAARWGAERADAALATAGVPPRLRPAALTTGQFAALARAVGP